LAVVKVSLNKPTVSAIKQKAIYNCRILVVFHLGSFY